MSTTEDIKSIRNRMSQIERKKAVAEANRDQAQKKLDETWTLLGEKYGIIKQDELDEAIADKKKKIADLISQANDLLDEAEGQ